MTKPQIDWAAIRAQVEAETIANKSAEILADPDSYECVACCIEGQLCDVGLAVQVERERIIALLQESDWHTSFFDMGQLIKLIKGNK